MRQIAAAIMTARMVTPPEQQATRTPIVPDDPALDRLPLRRRVWRRAASPSETWKTTHAGG